MRAFRALRERSLTPEGPPRRGGRAARIARPLSRCCSAPGVVALPPLLLQNAVPAPFSRTRGSGVSDVEFHDWVASESGIGVQICLLQSSAHDILLRAQQPAATASV
jgi:hypothetical protein